MQKNLFIKRPARRQNPGMCVHVRPSAEIPYYLEVYSRYFGSIPLEHCLGIVFGKL